MNKLVKLLSICIFSIFASTLVFAHDDHPTPAAHLTYKKGTLHIHADFLKTPIAGEEAFLKLEARDGKTHELIDIQDDVNVDLWMPEMNHGSSPTVVESAIDSKGNPITGTFIAKSLYFVMAGTWEVRVTLKDVNNASETNKFSLKISGSGHDH